MSRRNYWTSLRQRKISRRTMLGASAKAGVGAAGLALVGCGDDDDDAAPAAVDSRRNGPPPPRKKPRPRAAPPGMRAPPNPRPRPRPPPRRQTPRPRRPRRIEASAAASRPPLLRRGRRPGRRGGRIGGRRQRGRRRGGRRRCRGCGRRGRRGRGRDAAAAAVAEAAAEAAEAAAQAARDAAAAVEAGTATAAAAQAAINAAAEAAAAAAAAAGEASAAAGAAAATAQETAEAAAETAAAAVAAAEEAADAAQEAAESAAMAAEEEAPATGPQHGGVISFFGGDGGILDPAIADHGGLDSTIFPIYDHINYLDNGGALTAAMGELPEVVDELNFIYAIKPNVYWQDKAPLNGRQFVAEDAAFGLARFGQDNPEFIWRDRFASVDQFGVPDELTLHLTLKEPFAPLLTAVGEIQMLMVSRDAVEAFGDDAIASDPRGRHRHRRHADGLP